jgi:hypothetical protein
MDDAPAHTKYRLTEAAWAVAVFFVAVAVGALYTAYQDRPPQFFQEWFEPAVMLASGHGYTNVDKQALPPLAGFLDAGRPEINTFDPATLPGELPVLPLTAFHARHRYLLTAVAACFAALGIAWSSLWPLYGLLYGLSNVAAYGIFRVAMGRALALLCTAMLISSPLHLMKLPGLRDYSKAPFILLTLLIMAWLLTRPWKLRGHVYLGAAAGLTMGVGVGFRIDVLIVAVPLLVVWLVFAAGSWRDTLPARLGGLAALAAALLLTGGPILLTLAEGGNKSHPALLGLADRFDAGLELAMPPYNLQHAFYDAEVMLKLQAFEKHRTGDAPFLDYENPVYERIADDYYAAVLRTFPADFAVRALSAVVGVIEGLRPGSTYREPDGIDAPAQGTVYTIRHWIERVLLFRPLYMLAALLVGMAAVALRPAFGWCFLVLFFTGYTAAQFSTRHSFHLEFLPLLIGGAFYQRCLWAGLLCWRTGPGPLLASVTDGLRRHGRGAIIRVAVFGLAVTLGLLGPLWALRIIQQGRVMPLLESYATAPRVDVPYAASFLPDGAALLVPDAHSPDPELLDAPAFDMQYLVLTFDTARRPVQGSAAYTGAEYDNDLSHHFTLPATASGHTTLCIPVFRARLATENTEWVRFEGIVLDGGLDQLIALEAFENPFGFPFYMTVVLPPDLAAHALYQRRLP